VIDEVARAAATLAERKVGALMVLERDVGLSEYLEAGTLLDARVSRELLVSIFQTTSPIHDGAVVIRRGRVAAAGCYLPLTTSPAVSKALGSRHRAALGLTEETDAVVVVVSEEEGQISLVHEGRIRRGLDATTLRTALDQLDLP
jgi:diadenylate cyclase